MNENVLILSDLHYGDLADLDQFGRKGPAKREELELVAQSIVDSLIGSNQPIDRVIVLGDLTSRGSPGELQDVYFFLSVLCKLLKLDRKKLHLTYGNHDVDWKICDLSKEPESYHLAYSRAAAYLGGIFAPSGDYTTTGPVPGCGVANLEGIDLITLNSGIECYSNQTVSHGKLGEVQFQWLSSELPGLLREEATKVVILHHHPIMLPYAIPVQDLSQLAEGANAVKLFSQLGIDIVLHGHRHHPIIHTRLETDWSRPITFFCAGSFGVGPHHRANGQLPNTLHTITIPHNAGKLLVEGKVSSFKKNSALSWVPINRDDQEVSIDPVQWYGSAMAKQLAEQLIGDIFSNIQLPKTKGTFIELPEYIDLPLELRCLRHEELRKMVASKANSVDLVVTGKYPDSCIVTRS